VLLPADVIVAVEGVHLTFSHGRFGTIPTPWSLWRLVERVGANRALLLLTTGRPVGAAEAKAIGLVDEVVPDRAALEEYLATLQATMEMVSPAASRAAKAAIRAVSCHRPGYEKKVAEVFSSLLDGLEYREGLDALLEHRAPAWAVQGM
jgi:enoyl-CoA hydratase/carnithine racemase